MSFLGKMPAAAALSSPLHPVTISIAPVSFLDELKHQAQALQSRQQDHAALQAHNTGLTEEACNTLFQYWLELAQQLNVLQPRSESRYRLDGAQVFEALPMHDFHVDGRRQSLYGPPLYDVIGLSCRIGSGQPLHLEKDLPPEMAKLEDVLQQAGIRVIPETVREPESGRYLRTCYDFRLEFVGRARVEPNHELALLRFQLDNFQGFGRLVAEMPAQKLTRAVLDELARLMLGRPNRFMESARLARPA